MKTRKEILDELTLDDCELLYEEAGAEFVIEDGVIADVLYR